jgi:hypothetical protein
MPEIEEKTCITDSLTDAVGDRPGIHSIRSCHSNQSRGYESGTVFESLRQIDHLDHVTILQYTLNTNILHSHIAMSIAMHRSRLRMRCSLR